VKKLLSILLAFAVVCVVIPQISLAAQSGAPASPTRTKTLDLRDAAALSALAKESGVTVDGGVYANAAEGWSYDSASNTLTLSGAYIQAPAGAESFGVRLAGDAKIVLPDGTASVVNGGDASSGSSCGVFAQGGLAIDGGALTAAGGDAAADSYGIFALGAISISDGAVTATGGSSSGVGTTGIASEAGGITIKGAATTVDAAGGAANSSPEHAGQGGFANSMGIYALGGDVLIEDAVVNASGSSDSDSACGIHLNKGFEDGSGGILTIGGAARVTAVGGIVVNMQNAFGGAACIIGGDAEVDVSVADKTEGESIGISLTNGYLEVGENASVSVESGDGKYGSFGIFIGVDSESVGDNAGQNDGKLIMTGGALEVRSATARNSRAIVAHGDIEISGGTVVAQSGTASEQASTGIYSKKAISISGAADVTAKSGAGASLSAAVYADGGVTLAEVVVLSPAGGGVSKDGLYMSTADGADGDYASDVHIAPPAAESAAPQQSAEQQQVADTNG